MYLNTKQDYLNVKDDAEYRKLLDGEYRWMDTGAVVGAGIVDATHKVVRSEMMGVKTVNQFEWMPDPGCRMYEIGFTRAEILTLTGWADPGHEPKEWTPYEIPEPTIAEIKKQLADAVQLHLDTKVSERGYGSILAAVTYVGSQVTQWDTEAQVCLAWRDAVWTVVYQIMADVEQGLRPIPTKDELIFELPELIW